jgi:hypothetical protein
MTSITGIITALTGEVAIRVLANTADYQNRLPDPAGLRALETGAARPDLITRATGDPGYAVRDPVTLTVGALVILALQTEVKHPGPLDVHRPQAPDARLHPRSGDQQAPRLPAR